MILITRQLGTQWTSDGCTLESLGELLRSPSARPHARSIDLRVLGVSPSPVSGLFRSSWVTPKGSQGGTAA